MKNATKSQSVQYKIVHSSHGRLRVRIPRLTIDSGYSSRLESLIESLNFVTDARINSAASSIVVRYNEVAATEVLQEQILAAIEQASGIEDDVAQLLNNSPLHLDNDDSNLSKSALHKNEISTIVEPIIPAKPSKNDELNDEIALPEQDLEAIAKINGQITPLAEDLDPIAKPNDAPLDERTAQEYSLLIRGNYSVSVKLDAIEPLAKEPFTI